MKMKKEPLLRGGAGNGRSCAVAYAVAAGVVLGLLVAFFHPSDIFDFSSDASPASAAYGQDPAVIRKAKRLEAEIKHWQEEGFRSEQKVINLEQQVQRAQREKADVEAQLKGALPPGGKIGAQGTVRGLRTWPLVEPDESVNPELASILKDVALNNEVIVGICDSNVKAMVQVWFQSIQRVGVKNFMVVALDDTMAEFAKEHNVPFYRRDAIISGPQKQAGHNHAVSGLKFHLLRDFLVLGYNVFLSDIDIVFLQNPWNYLTRDSDVEGMTDGHDNRTAYGYDDVWDDEPMGWSRYAHTMRIWVFNSGLFYIRATRPSIELLDRVTDRLSKQKNAWDQAVFNEELFFPSSPGYLGLHASKRVLDYLLFLNSKVLFRDFRDRPLEHNWRPVTIHVNYHPDKFDRMLAIVDYYVNGNSNALAKFPVGSA
eukprot:TRINITY_DN817_c0_g1_i1.p1 TRINITY_DN817_c0_g1~~TRINITY_DN817_c0_g1_i1.p1  ORF type:complete len:427 (+),score=85.07 TRINITY_DN817_c0_g1_i1:161-1441(+)